MEYIKAGEAQEISRQEAFETEELNQEGKRGCRGSGVLLERGDYDGSV